MKKFEVGVEISKVVEARNKHDARKEGLRIIKGELSKSDLLCWEVEDGED